jgi:glycerol kinase
MLSYTHVYLAGPAVGFWESQEEISQQWAIDRQFNPKMTDETRNENILWLEKSSESSNVL